MTSDRKIAANRKNGRKSSGPRSAAGKSIASRNRNPSRFGGIGSPPIRAVGRNRPNGP